MENNFMDGDLKEVGPGYSDVVSGGQVAVGPIRLSPGASDIDTALTGSA